MCSVTEIPSVTESDMQQNLQCLLSTACPTDSVHDVILQVCAAVSYTHLTLPTIYSV